MAHVRYIKILTWLQGFRVKIENSSRLNCLKIPRRELSTKKKTKPNKEKMTRKPRSHIVATFRVLSLLRSDEGLEHETCLYLIYQLIC